VETAGTLDAPRSRPSLVELPQTLDVVVLGGASGTEALSSAEKLVYREDTGRYMAEGIASPMGTPRYLHTSSLLSNGLILMTGGVGADQQSLDSVEVFNPDDGSPGGAGASDGLSGEVDEDGFLIP
jgi:hypothetical protein